MLTKKACLTEYTYLLSIVCEVLCNRLVITSFLLANIRPGCRDLLPDISRDGPTLILQVESQVLPRIWGSMGQSPLELSFRLYIRRIGGWGAGWWNAYPPQGVAFRVSRAPKIQNRDFPRF